MKYDNQLRYAVSIIQKYDGHIPLTAWLKEFFRQNKQMGSRDRKTLSELVYGYYRLGHYPTGSIEERILMGVALSGNLPEFIEYFSPAFPPREDIISKLFPWSYLLSDAIDKEAFADSFLTQPDLFVRIRPGKEDIVTRKLKVAGIEYAACGDFCIAISNNTKLDSILKMNEEAVVQDRSSQGTLTLLNDIAVPPQSVWDCCAGSGGKSIMAHDLFKDIKITVSDIRSSIINNLKERFHQAGITGYHSFVTDLTKPNEKLSEDNYDLILADVPCTGSGTWSRTPEQLYFFKEEGMVHYNRLQRHIVETILPKIKPGGSLLYITCSVFKKENEDMVEFILGRSGYQLVKMEWIKGYAHKADTMFAALFTS